jgi:hypothetical protein
MPGCVYDHELRRYTVKADGCAASHEHGEEPTCAECGYSETMHRAYEASDGRPDVYLGGSRHRWRPTPSSRKPDPKE